MSETFRIMLVEDSRTQAVQLRYLLESQGWDVAWVDSGEAAIDQIGRYVPDLILLDYHLPGVLGDEVCRQVRMRIDTRVIGLIMLTADSDKEVEARGLEAGADDFLRKSEDSDTLLLRIRTMLNRSRAHHSILNTSERYFRRSRLLAVDDSPTYLAHLTNELGKEVYHLETANNSEDAYKRVLEDQIDCVLVDMVMPGTDGIALCRQIDALRRDGKVRAAIVMLTANDDKSGLTAALDAGADDFVGKSSDITVLKVRIRAALRRKFYEEENKRILEELKDRELEAQRAKLEKQTAQARAALADQLEETANELRKSNQELRRFAYVGHHHLQHPLRTVAGYCRLLQKRYQAQLDAQAHHYLDGTIGAVLRMKTLLQDLLNYSTLVAPSLRMERVDCNQLLTEARGTLEETITSSNATIVSESLPTITGDRGQILRLFVELIDNALKYRSDAPPRVHITAQCDRPDHEAAPDAPTPSADHADSSTSSAGPTTPPQWTFTVRDNGMGIDPQFAQRIFTLFERLHADSEFSGTGIGLAMCRKIVESHRGLIWMESKPGEGTCFHFILPQHPPKKEQQAPVEEPGNEPTGGPPGGHPDAASQTLAA